MNNVSNFYDELDLKYPEIAICIDEIDRLNPGSPRFVIPILTPSMSKDEEYSTTVFQNSSNICNGDISPEISNITMTNYITIPLPKELCGGPDIKFLQSMKFMCDASVSCNSGGNAEYHWCNGILNKVFKTALDFITPDVRYIKKKSKWIVVFVGGDITDPRIIAPYEQLPVKRR